MVADHVLPRGRHERADARDQVERLEQQRDGAVLPRLLQRVAKLAAPVFLEAILRDRRPTHIPAQPLEPSAIARRDGHLGVDVEAHDFGERLHFPCEARLHDAQEGLPRPSAIEAEARGRRAVACGEGELLGGLRVLGVTLAGAVQRAALAREDFLHAERGPLRDVSDLVSGGLRQGVEHQQRVGIFADVDAVQSEHMEVDIQPQRRVSALDEAHGSGQRLLHRTQVEHALRAVLQRVGERHHERLEHRRAELPVVAAEHAEPPRQRAHPLPNRDFGEDLLHEVDSRVRHAPPQTGRAKSAVLARKSDQPLEAAPVTADTHAAVLEPAAPQVVLDLAHHEARQPADLFSPLAERRPVRLDGAVEHRLLRTVPLVAAVGLVVRGRSLSHGHDAQGRVVPEAPSSIVRELPPLLAPRADPNVAAASAARGGRHLPGPTTRRMRVGPSPMPVHAPPATADDDVTKGYVP